MAKRAREESSFRTNPEFVQQLLTTNAETLVPPDNRIFIAQRTDKVVDVWKGLIKHNFSSVPVLQKTKNKYYGFVDIADIVQFAVKTFGKEKLSQDVDFWQQFEKEESLKDKTVNDIMVFPSSRRNPFHPVTKGYSLYSAVELLARERGLHRVPVVDDNRQLVNLITQSQVLRYLQTHMKELGSIKDKPISEMRYSQNPVLCISQDELAIAAFDLMVKEAVTGIAVIDANGKIVDNISMRDLKAIQSDGRMFWRLHQTCHNFLLKIRKEFAPQDGRPMSVVTVSTKDKLETVINQCATHGIHRIYVVDDHKKPIGVIALKDILLEIITSI